MGEGPKQALGRGVMPALHLAVKHVNAHLTILRNSKLHVVWNDTKVSLGEIKGARDLVV